MDNKSAYIIAAAIIVGSIIIAFFIAREGAGISGAIFLK
ncbi:hypothetical protein ABID14_000555 [Peptoniphilus olsenii]|uniref:Uncharacterized protein n=1 Tax=Peptoniphilus olsenii TaxID=411570 RepID=A0ABV2J837_9FIRM